MKYYSIDEMLHMFYGCGFRRFRTERIDDRYELFYGEKVDFPQELREAAKKKGIVQEPVI
jgi:hypothetical protein